MESASGSDYYERKSTLVNGVSWLDKCREGFKDGFRDFEALACWC